MLKLIVVLSLVVVCFGQTPPRPKIAESFLLKGVAIVRGKEHGVKFDADGEVTMAEDNANVRRYFHLNFYEGKDDATTLELFQQKMQYEVFSEGVNATCTPRQLAEKYTPAFGWVEEAKYTGSLTVDGVVYDFWTLDEKPGNFAEIGVEHSDPNALKYFNFDVDYSYGTQDLVLRVQINVDDFTAETPPASYFYVPKPCM